MKKIKNLFKILFSWTTDSDGHSKILRMCVLNGRKDSDINQQDILRGMKSKKENHEKRTDSDIDTDGV